MASERIQKIIASAGVTSRRDAEALIRAGKVTVNGVIVKTLGVKADSERDVILVDGNPIHIDEVRVTIMMNKPEGYIVSASDPENRPTVFKLLDNPPSVRGGIKGKLPRLFPVGRLDFDAEGLLLLTNDGDLADKLMHPKHHVPKTYLIKVSGVLAPYEIKRIEEGLHIGTDQDTLQRSLPATVELHRRTDRHAWYKLTVFEGRHHLVKKLLYAVGHSVRRIIRIAVGGVQLGALPKGTWRVLLPAEVARLKNWIMRSSEQDVETLAIKLKTKAHQRKTSSSDTKRKENSARKRQAQIRKGEIESSEPKEKRPASKAVKVKEMKGKAPQAGAGAVKKALPPLRVARKSESKQALEERRAAAPLKEKRVKSVSTRSTSKNPALSSTRSSAPKASFQKVSTSKTKPVAASKKSLNRR